MPGCMAAFTPTSPSVLRAVTGCAGVWGCAAAGPTGGAATGFRLHGLGLLRPDRGVSLPARTDRYPKGFDLLLDEFYVAASTLGGNGTGAVGSTEQRRAGDGNHRVAESLGAAAGHHEGGG